jgi:hypothetical protein
MNENLRERIERFAAMAALQHNGRWPEDVNHREYRVKFNRNYAKVSSVRPGDDLSETVEAFVCMKDGKMGLAGDILKPAGWNAPARHARGSVYASDGGEGALNGQGGVRYL